MHAFMVYYLGRWLDTVFRNETDERLVTRALLSEGYPTAIVVLPATY
jgi:hypothetical protein